MSETQRLELSWIGKGERPRLEPRILLEDSTKSYHATQRVSDADLFDNRLIFGDNLLALRALEQEFSGKVKCIYVDPPYNTGNAFEHYDDGIEHSLWLSLMRDRVEILKNLLRDDGFFCCHIDDSEGAYLKVLLDEIFGRDNYLTTLYVRVRYTEKTLKQDMDFHKQVEYVHVYRKAYGAFPYLQTKDASFDKFCYYIEAKLPHATESVGGKQVDLFLPGSYNIVQGEGSETGLKEIWATGSILDGNSSGRFFRDYLSGRVSRDGLGVLYRVWGIGDDQFPYRYFTGPKKQTATKGKYFQGVPNGKLGLDGNSDSTSPIENFYDLAGSFGNCRQEGGVEFRSGKKPELLLQKILYHFTKPGDIVLDSFAGSGTTGAVAQKMGRRWIMIELREHCHTHIIPRLKKVIDGDDQSGVTEAVGWHGGGGFRYFRLAPSLLVKDRFENWVIAPSYNAAMLAEAVCKLMGFTYAPSQEAAEYWRHGYSTEMDFIYVTTQSLTYDALKKLSEEVGAKRTLLVCCKAWSGNDRTLENLTIKKIPQAVLKKCEWGRDDYSLKVADLPAAIASHDVAVADAAPAEDSTPTRRGRSRKTVDAGPSLFATFGKAADE